MIVSTTNMRPANAEPDRQARIHRLALEFVGRAVLEVFRLGPQARPLALKVESQSSFSTVATIRRGRATSSRSPRRPEASRRSFPRGFLRAMVSISDAKVLAC